MTIVGFIAICIVWWFLGGSLFLAAPAFMHSGINLDIYYAKRDGVSTFYLKLARVGICCVYPIFFVGFGVLYCLWF